MKFRTRRARGPDVGGWTARPAFAVRGGRLARLLDERASLTAALQAHGSTRVTVLRQRLARPDADELHVMGIRAHRLRMVREVLLRVDGAAWVFAHTVANAAGQALLRRAGKRPLAAVLFADPRVVPGPLRYRRLDRRHPLYHSAAAWCTPAPQRLDARRARFTRGAACVLVTEVFLPAAG